MSKDYDEEYYLKAYDYIRNETDYTIRAAIALKKYFSDINDIHTKKILEIGAGLGKNIYFLKNATAYDISPFSKKFCKKKGIPVVSHIHSNTYDLIASIHTLEHIAKPLSHLQEIYAKLKKGGIFLLILPYERHRLTANFQPDNNNHLYAWNFRSIDNLLYHVGFRVLKNEFIYDGFAYKKLRSVYAKNPAFVYSLTKHITRICSPHQRELKILAVKD